MKSLLYYILSIPLPLISLAAEVTSGEVQADKYVRSFNKYELHHGEALDGEQKEALRTSHEVLLKASLDPDFREYFWYTVRGIKREVTWDIAQQMISRGQIRIVSQSHSLSVTMLSFEGELITTQAPSISAPYEIIGEVDPKRVFVIYSTE